MIRENLLSGKGLEQAGRGIERTARSLERTSEQVVSSATTLRRKIDMTLLRWQAHLDTPLIDRLFPWFSAFLLTIVLVLLSLARFRDLGMGEQIGYYIQAAHLIDVGESPEISQLGLNIFALQAAWLFWPIAWFSKLFPTGEFLLTIQAMALGVSVVPIWRIARGPANLRTGGAIALTLVYSLHPSIHALALVGFHPESFAIPALLTAYLASTSGRWWYFSSCACIVLVSRADLGLAIFALGLILLMENRRFVGRIVSSCGLAWFLLMAFLVQPLMSNSSYPHSEAFSDYGGGPFGIIFGMLGNPFLVIGDIFSRSNFEQIFLLIAPILFLPLVCFRYLLPVFPLLTLYLIAEVPENSFGNPQQNVPVIVFLFISASFGLSKIGTLGFSRIYVGRRILTVLFLLSVVFFVRDSSSSPYERPWEWGKRDEVDIARLTSVYRVGDEASIMVPANLYPKVSDRKNAYVLDHGDISKLDVDAVKKVDALVFDQNFLDLERKDIDNFKNFMSSNQFTQRYESKGIQVWLRNFVFD